MPRFQLCRSMAIALSFCCVALCFCEPGRAEIPIANASFEQGAETPTGWTLDQGSGSLISPGAVGKRAISVRGDGKSSNAWTSPPVALAANTVYRLQFQARRVSGTGGLLVTGPRFCNRDLSGVPRRWTRFESIFVTPEQSTADQLRLRFGQWQVPGQVAFDDLRLDRVIPIYRSADDIQLGAGEIIKSGQYTFNAPLGTNSANHARPLARHQCSFNSNRWVLSSPATYVIYRHHVARMQREATIHAQIGWYRHGELLIEVSGDGQHWQDLGTITESGPGAFKVPNSRLPADEVWVRISARKKAGERAAPALQMSSYRYEATLRGKVPDLVGSTRFLAVTHEASNLEVSVLGIGDGVPGGHNFTDLQLRNTTDHPLTLDISASASPVTRAANSTEIPPHTPVRLTLAPGATSRVLHIPYHLHGVDAHRLKISVTGNASFAAETKIDIPALYAAHYGAALPHSSDALGLWWCSSGWKISVQRPTPKQASEALVIRAAANETEAAQLVIRPQRAIADLTSQVSDLTGPDGARIPAVAIEIQRVRYVHVTQPTDSTGTVGLWPDPLPPLRSTESVPANRNFPLWVRVHVPKGQAPGLYRGSITLQGNGTKVTAPLHVEVFGFELPDRMTCKTAFGLSTSLIWRYHHLTTESQQREVLGKYLRCLADHHISPYEPAPLDPIHITWKNTPAWGGGQRDTTNPHRGTYALKVADLSTTASVSAQYLPAISIPAKGLKLSFWHRVAETTANTKHPFIVTLLHYDANGQWMSGRNNDLRVTGTTAWQQFEHVVERFPRGATSVRLQLRATLWNEQGTPTGTVWFDDVSLTDQATGKQLVSGGEFESEDQPTPAAEFDFARWDRAMTRAIDQLHFNTFRLGVPGLGGGTFHARYEPELLGYAEDTPQYQSAMKSYLGKLQEHLRKKGWLDEAFIYWFDEPSPKDYEFVNNGFAKLKRWAPDIPRMLTEQVEPNLVGGPNIWCPVSSSYNDDNAQQRRKAGDDFWWYVCTGPKAPYCTLFIDHPGTEMRVWLWQTWQRKISGILVWQSNYWTSPSAYPDRAAPQDPYADPMGWVSGYSTPEGARRAWGNGDGRLLYPPEAAANGKAPGPVLDKPVDSIRLEMLRDGIEDYEYLTILKRLLHERQAELTVGQRAEYEELLKVPAEITSDMTTFTSDPEPIETRRRAIARAIESLAP